MSWPPVNPPVSNSYTGSSGVPSSGYLAEGLTTIVWGTTGFSTGFLLSYIVKTVRPSQRVEELRVENGIGLTATEILLIDGQDFEVTVVDDSTVTPAAVGSIISLLSPFNAGGTPANFLVVNNSYNAARKQEGERVLLCRKFTLINL